MDDAPVDTPDGIAPRRRWLAVVLSATIVVAVAVLVAPRLRLWDPYRPGTTHRASTELIGCDRPGGLRVEGDPEARWDSHDRLPATWPRVPMTGGATATVAGVLAVRDDGTATFIADQGGSVSFVRMGANQLPRLDCPIASDG